MSSLPQGWHGLSKAPRRSLTGKITDFVSSVPKFRWNSPQAQKINLSQPTIRRSSGNMLPNGFQSKITPPRSSAKALNNTSLKSEILANSAKDSQHQIAGLKKDIATLKAENTVLKARVRKLDDENAQLSRQITKLKVDSQKESVQQRKNKDEPVAALRQKVLRLESALKDKDQSIKKMVLEVNALKIEELKDIVVKYQKQFGIKNGLGGDMFQRRKLLQSTTSNPPPVKPVRVVATDQVSSAQMDRLRNMLHKRDAEVQTLQQQIKTKDQEMRQLKVQLSQQTRSSSTPARPSSTPRISLSSSRSSIPNRTAASSIPVTSHVTKGKTTVSSTSISKVPQCQPRVSALPRVTRSQSLGIPQPTRVQSVPKLKPKVSPRSRPLSQKEIEKQAQWMRENIAARKIQQGWRHHREMMNKGEMSSENKAFNLIHSELRAHKSRKNKLSAHQENWKLSAADEEHFSNIVSSEFLKLTELQSNLPEIH